LERRPGLQREVLASFALVMLAATGVLATLLVVQAEGRLRDLLGRALMAETRASGGAHAPSLPGAAAWFVHASGEIESRGGAAEPADAESLTLAAEARRRGAALLSAPSPWTPIRFAAPASAPGEVAVIRLPASAWAWLQAAPRWALLGVIAADVAIFTAFGATLLRRRVVLPLKRLAEAARAITGGAQGARVPVEGTSETADVAIAFNEMTEALESRTGALEKAVRELRDANRELRLARAGLDRAERLAAVGSLAAGVAHEVGNPMGAILAFLDLARRDPQTPARVGGHLERAAREGERVRVILRQLLDFSRPQRTEPSPVDVRALLEEVVALVRAQRRYAGIELEIGVEGAPPPALADRAALTQILLNLLLNAADAVRGRPEPRVTLTVAPTRLGVRAGEGPCELPPGAEPDAVECRIQDNGPGIPEPLRERVFDPFFTTKPPGEGTGLGLAKALRLTEQIGGRLELVADGQGALFVLRLPRAAAPVTARVRQG
jgi:signal transduction histidine kinase